VNNAGTPGVPQVTLNYGYDVYNNRTYLQDSLGGNISSSYDGAHRLTNITGVMGGSSAVLALSYDAASRLTSISRSPPGDNITTSFSYDNANRLTNIAHTDATKALTLAGYTYGYDAASQLTNYSGPDGSLTYGYDVDGQLTSVTGARSESFSYDKNGNRTMAGYTTGAGNELTSDGVYNYTYDNEGNTLTQTQIATGTVTNYTWDYRNRLTEVQVKSSTGTVLNDEKFTYDVNDNRIGVMLNGVQQSWTVFDGANPYMDFNGSGALTERYLTNPNGLSQFYARVSASGVVNWYLTDNLGSIRQIVDTSGTVLDTLVYSSFGTIVSETNAANGDRFKFAGGANDLIAGMNQFNRRYQRPADGNFASEDPLSFGAGDTNLYRYVFNSPTSATDPSGEFDPITWGFIIGAGIIILGGCSGCSSKPAPAPTPPAPVPVPPAPAKAPPKPPSEADREKSIQALIASTEAAIKATKELDKLAALRERLAALKQALEITAKIKELKGFQMSMKPPPPTPTGTGVMPEPLSQVGKGGATAEQTRYWQLWTLYYRQITELEMDRAKAIQRSGVIIPGVPPPP